MSSRERAEVFTRLVGLELKGRIVSRGFTAQQVARAGGRSPAAFSRWLNGKVEIPLAVLCESCEIIGVDPKDVVEAAYGRLGAEGRSAPPAGATVALRGAPHAADVVTLYHDELDPDRATTAAPATSGRAPRRD
ncbi:helix-turn-helix domain-containing protein [Cellulomonas triticagri]|uniref:helix-turn-helix domain-containing protein n=1 Tax=Cellulomonas triticagri TaxID=2483352 RepID=UPI0013158995|nr:helix-turn-helix transcriptional regulator [Cellulomonas triticagri]